MGWLFSSQWETRADLLAYLRSTERFGNSNVLVKSQAVGNNHWYLARHADTGQVWIGLDKMQGGTRRDRGWGYKDLDESCGPSVVNCPISYLKLAGEPTGHALAWREEVRKYHAGRSKVKPKPGDIARYGGIDYRLERPYAPRKGWVAVGLKDGVSYRIKAHQLTRAEINPTAPL